MIISVSRRTDIPAYYSPWFWNRLRDGYVLVRQPVNERRVSRIVLHPDVVDGFVFWTKNPAPMLARLGELEEYAYYFQYTLTAYGSNVEPGIPSKRECLIPAFQELSRRIGPERVIWRYGTTLYFSVLNIRKRIMYGILPSWQRSWRRIRGGASLAFLITIPRSAVLWPPWV